MPDIQPPADIDPAQPRDPADAQHPRLRRPVDVRSLSLAVLAVLASVFMLHWASAVFIPLMLGLIISYALAPIVDRLERMRVPRVIGAALLMITMVAGVGGSAYALSDDATQFAESLPEAAQKIRRAVRAQPNRPETAIDKVQKAATQLEQAAKESSASPAPERGVTRVQIERPKFSIKDYIWSSTPGLVASIGQATVVLFIAFFLLSAGDTFRRKIVKLAGPTLTQKKVTVQAMDEINAQIQRYLLVQVLISAIVGLATWIAYLLIGVEHAAIWGVLAFVLNFIPYIGSIVITGGSAMVGFVQFGSVDMALLVAGVSLLLHVVSGYLLTPWLLSRANRMNPVAVFVGLLAFGWLWGVWGLLLGLPILMMVKAVCDRVDDLRLLGELLGA